MVSLRGCYIKRLRTSLTLNRERFICARGYDLAENRRVFNVRGPSFRRISNQSLSLLVNLIDLQRCMLGKYVIFFALNYTYNVKYRLFLRYKFSSLWYLSCNQTTGDKDGIRSVNRPKVKSVGRQKSHRGIKLVDASPFVAELSVLHKLFRS